MKYGLLAIKGGLMIKEDIPDKALRMLDALFLSESALKGRDELKNKIVSWAETMLSEARQAWCDMRNDTIHSVILTDRKAEALKKAGIRDEKYAPFRKYFYLVQKEKFFDAAQKGEKLTANGFVRWFLSIEDMKVQIPYVKQNQQNKLIQLAQKNNREFKELLKSGVGRIR